MHAKFALGNPFTERAYGSEIPLDPEGEGGGVGDGGGVVCVCVWCWGGGGGAPPPAGRLGTAVAARGVQAWGRGQKRAIASLAHNQAGTLEVLMEEGHLCTPEKTSLARRALQVWASSSVWL